MLSAIRSELRKYRTTRMWWGMALGVLATALVFSGAYTLVMTMNGSGGATGPTPGSADFAVNAYTAGLQVVQILCLVVGVVIIGSEFRHRTATATFLGTPRRWKVVLAKVVAVALACLGYGLLSLVAGVGIGAAILAAKGYDVLPDPSLVGRSLALSLLVAVVWGLIGLGIGTLVRNQVAALLLAVGFAFIVEPLVSLLLSMWQPAKGVAKFFPSMATTAVMSGAQNLPPGTEILGWWQAALVLLGYAAAMTVLGLLLTLRRDVG